MRYLLTTIIALALVVGAQAQNPNTEEDAEAKTTEVSGAMGGSTAKRDEYLQYDADDLRDDTDDCFDYYVTYVQPVYGSITDVEDSIIAAYDAANNAEQYAFSGNTNHASGVPREQNVADRWSDIATSGMPGTQADWDYIVGQANIGIFWFGNAFDAYDTAVNFICSGENELYNAWANMP